jgi:hypothetical protein
MHGRMFRQRQSKMHNYFVPRVGDLILVQGLAVLPLIQYLLTVCKPLMSRDLGMYHSNYVVQILLALSLYFPLVPHDTHPSPSIICEYSS